jgi:hypothetical protein
MLVVIGAVKHNIFLFGSIHSESLSKNEVQLNINPTSPNPIKRVPSMSGRDNHNDGFDVHPRDDLLHQIPRLLSRGILLLLNIVLQDGSLITTGL